jgi:hypothetical protein
MAQFIDPDIQALYDAGRLIKSRALAFHLDSGTLGLWTGEGTLSEGGVDYLGAGEDMLRGVPLNSGLGDIPDALQLTLSVVENGSFDPANTISGIEQEPYNGRPLLIYDVYFNPDTMARVGGFRRRWTGVIDKVTHRAKGGLLTVEVIGEMKTLFDMSMSPSAVRSDATQRARNPSDGFLRHATGVNRPVYLLRKPPEALA